MASAAKRDWEYQPLQSEQLRWFWISEGSGQPIVPAREKVTRFCDADCAALERAFSQQIGNIASGSNVPRGSPQQQQRQQDQPRCSDKLGQQTDHPPGSYSCSTAAAAAAAMAADNSTPSSASFSRGDWKGFGTQDQGRRPGVLVRGGQYEVNLPGRCMYPCYWPGEASAVVRGTWFAAVRGGGAFVPLRDELAGKLEEAYRRAVWRYAGVTPIMEWQPDAMSARVELCPGMYAAFVSSTAFYLYYEAPSSASSASSSASSAAAPPVAVPAAAAAPPPDTAGGAVAGAAAAAFAPVPPSDTVAARKVTGNGAKLVRGYMPSMAVGFESDPVQEALDEYCARAPVTRLVLLVHGVGQALEYVNNVEDVNRFRELVRRASRDHLPPRVRAAGWTEVLPVQWRKQLSLEVEPLARALRPPGIEALRDLKAATATEFLLYMSDGGQRQALLASLRGSLNTVYRRFMARHPDFQGTVSLVGHSLGAVLCYDLLTQQQQGQRQCGGLHLAVGKPPPLPIQITAAHRQWPLAGALGHSKGEGGAGGGGGDGTAQVLLGVSPSDSATSWDGWPPTAAAPATATAAAATAVSGQAEAWQAPWGMPAADAAGSAAAAAAGPAAAAATAADQPSGASSPSSCSRGLATVTDQPCGDAPSAPRARFVMISGASMRMSSGLPQAMPTQQQQQQHRVAADPVDGVGGPAAAASASVGGPAAAAAAAPADGVSVSNADGGRQQEGEQKVALEFGVDVFLGMGSPLGLLLALQGVDPRVAPLGRDPSRPLPACSQMLNLFHPFDPVAYRIEPLVFGVADALPPPCVVPRVEAPAPRPGFRGVRAWGQDLLASMFFRKLVKAAQNMQASSSSGGGSNNASSSGSGGASSSHKPKQHDEQGKDAGDVAATGSGRTPCSASQIAGQMALRRGREGGASATTASRMDFMLKESPGEHEYVAALTAHFYYWGSADTALFVARAVHGLDVMGGSGGGGGDAG